MASECCLAKASTSAFTVRVCSVVKRIRSLPAASNSTMVLPQVPSPTTAALIMLTSSLVCVLLLLLLRPCQQGEGDAGQNIQKTQYSMPPITQIHFLVTL